MSGVVITADDWNMDLCPRKCQVREFLDAKAFATCFMFPFAQWQLPCDCQTLSVVHFIFSTSLPPSSSAVLFFFVFFYHRVFDSILLNSCIAPWTGKLVGKLFICPFHWQKASRPESTSPCFRRWIVERQKMSSFFCMIKSLSYSVWFV